MSNKQNSSKRLTKAKGHPPASDFIALGLKSSSVSTISDTTSTTTLTTSSSKSNLKSSSGTAGAATSTSTKQSDSKTSSSKKLGKRDGSTTFGSTSKRQKLSTESSRASPQILSTLHEKIAEDIDHETFSNILNDALEKGEDERIEKLICGAIKYMKLNCNKESIPDNIGFTLSTIASTHKDVFVESKIIIEGLCSILKRDILKSRYGPDLVDFVCGVIMTSFSSEVSWPDIFIKLWLEDAIGEKLWINRSECAEFSANIKSAFNTKIPSCVQLEDNGNGKSGRVEALKVASTNSSPSCSPKSTDERQDVITETKVFSLPDYDPFPRYETEKVNAIVGSFFKEVINKRHPFETDARSLIQAMSYASGVPEVRLCAAQKLEMWLNNPKYLKISQDLMLCVCYNCNEFSQIDVETMSALVKIRLKSKAFTSAFITAIQLLVQQHPQNLKTLMTQTVFNELSQNRNPNNMSLLVAMCQAEKRNGPKALGEIFQDLFLQKDDFLKAVRILLREVVRFAKQDLNLVELVRSFFTTELSDKLNNPTLEKTIKIRCLYAIVDIICSCCLLFVTPSIRECASACFRGDFKDFNLIMEFHIIISQIQCDCMQWFHGIQKICDLNAEQFLSCIRKILFLEKSDVYYKIDGWPPDQERNVMLRITSEVPVLEDTLMWILLLGLGASYPIGHSEALDIADKLIRRSALLFSEHRHKLPPNYHILNFKKLDLIKLLVELCVYKLPEQYTLPIEYCPPQLAVVTNYWKIWIMFLILSSFSPETFGKEGWNEYPQVRCFMEMIITRQLIFPPPTMAPDNNKLQEILARENRMQVMERDAILEYEGHLANKPITVENSLLISQTMLLETKGPARAPPPSILEEVSILMRQLNLGIMLCKCREPDFLSDLIQSQGTSQSRPWLAELVESNKGALDHLPVQCLCEFLLYDINLDEEASDWTEDISEKNAIKRKSEKQASLLEQLKSLIYDPGTEISHVSDILQFFLQRLILPNKSSRLLAGKGISLILSKQSSVNDSSDEEIDMETDDTYPLSKLVSNCRWLLEDVPKLPKFEEIQGIILSGIIQALRVETDNKILSAYLAFLATKSDQLELNLIEEIADILSHIIINRSNMTKRLLEFNQSSDNDEQLRSSITKSSVIQLFYTFLHAMISETDEDISMVEGDVSDVRIRLEWPNKREVIINIDNVQAMIILLSYGKPHISESYYDEMEDLLLPDKRNLVNAFKINSAEPAILMPNWFRNRIIMSNVDKLVSLVLCDSTVSQLLTLIQTFGTPKKNIEKIILKLEESLNTDAEEIEANIRATKTVISNQVRVAFRFGINAPKVFSFFDFLQSDRKISHLNDSKIKTLIPKNQNIPLKIDSNINISEKNVKNLLMKAIVNSKSNESDYAHQILKCVMKFGMNSVTNSNLVIASMLSLADQYKVKFFEGVIIHHQYFVNFLRLIESLDNEKTKLKDFLNCLQKNTDQTLLQKFLTGCLSNSNNKEVVVSLKENLNNNILNAIKTGNICEIVTKICGILKTKELTDLLHPSMFSLLLDWLRILDPELTKIAPEYERKLIFGHQTSKNQYATNILLNSLVHNSSLDVLQKCLNSLLTESSQYDATIVLDFYCSLICLPKIRQGRENRQSINASRENVLNLNSDEICFLISYVIREARMNNMAKIVSLDVKNKISHRLTAIWKCCSDKYLSDIVNYLRKEIESVQLDDKFNKDILHYILLQIYVEMPYIIEIDNEISDFINENFTEISSSSKLDKTTHNIICALGAQKTSGYDANLACRKLAAIHPLLVLRQLPLIEAQMAGKALFTPKQLKHKNHHILYAQVLGILELLQPYIFHLTFMKSLDGILIGYFELFQRHLEEMKQTLSPLLKKFIKFLEIYHSYRPNNAKIVIDKYIEFLNFLSNENPDIPDIQTLLSSLSIPIGNQSVKDERRLFKIATPIILTSIQSNLVNTITLSTSTIEILEALKEIDNVSKGSADMLLEIRDQMKILMFSKETNIRNTTMNLIMRLLREYPSLSDEFVDFYIKMLDNKLFAIVESGLKHLPEFTLLAKEKSQSILKKALIVSLVNQEATGLIADSLRVLNLDTIQFAKD